MSIQNFQKPKESGNIQSKRAGHSPIVTVHTVTVINVMSLTSKCFAFKEKIREDRSCGRKSNLSKKTHRSLARAGQEAYSASEVWVYLLGIMYICMEVCVYSLEVGCTHHYVHGRQRQPSALPTTSFLRIKRSGQHGYQGLYSLSHLCSPINLVLKAMWSCRGGKVECGSKMFVVSSRKADRHTFRVAVCKHSLTLGLPGGNQAYTEKNLPFKEKWTT